MTLAQADNIHLGGPVVAGIQCDHQSQQVVGLGERRGPHEPVHQPRAPRESGQGTGGLAQEPSRRHRLTLVLRPCPDRSNCGSLVVPDSRASHPQDGSPSHPPSATSSMERHHTSFHISADRSGCRWSVARPLESSAGQCGRSGDVPGDGRVVCGRGPGRADVRVVVLSGEGPHFCAGNDLDEFATMTPRTDGSECGRCARPSSPLRIAVCPS